MRDDTLNKEQRILIAMRKTLAGVVKDTTPLPGRRHLLKEGTIRDIRHCFSLISARERELAGEKAEGAERKVSAMRPRYADEPHDEKVVPVAAIKKTTAPNQ
ncbi:MAG: segregation and condensation protein A [Gammaproteobacteria bacterium]|nr:segregation and condensation protein A [Gammaproteobacteria bacterium]